MTSIQIIEQVYQAFENRDYDLFRQVCDADVEWIQNPGFPNGGRHRGPEAVIQNVFETFSDDWDYFRFDMEDRFASADETRVMVTGIYAGRYRRTGKEMEAAAAHVYELADRKVKRFRQFTDTAVILAATQP